MDTCLNLKNLGYHNLKKRIKLNEGFSLKPYRDQLGYLTIGYGHLVLSNEKILLKKKLNKKEFEKIFEKDFKKAISNFNNRLKPITSNKKEEELLIEMVFQLGIKGCITFKNLIRNMRKGKKYLVCFEMMDSLWYIQTPNRVKALIKTFLNNE
ncbi:glycoside hydrolase family protein [Alphaproteobacteria bacterium]|nr:glycoside hydrolase family protein [Alphaproteobacteria bacterium]